MRPKLRNSPHILRQRILYEKAPEKRGASVDRRRRALFRINGDEICARSGAIAFFRVSKRAAQAERKLGRKLSLGILKTPTSKIKFAIACLLAIAIARFSACSSAPQKPLRIATNVWVGYEPLYLAKSLNFKKAPSLKLFRMTSASAVISAFRNRRVDAAALTLDEALLLVQDGIDARIILVMDASNGGDAVIGTKKIKHMKDLKGKRVGVESSAVGAYMLSRALELSGMKPDDIEMVSITVDAHEKTFLEGRVEAVATFDPVRSALVKKGGNVLFDSSRIPNEILDVLVVHNDVLKDREADIRGLIDMWFSTLDYIEKSPADAFAKMGALENISGAEFEAAVKLIRIPDKKENIKLLSGARPGLETPAKKLSKTMLARKLLIRKVDAKKLLPEKLLIK